ncbi:hypothetical protein BKA83DRAFT_4486486 [Pisolithus microcarpus]|nr:hypothetical protein BKA83DRAFT_4486486 [Pisolithus microcarpus]
MASSQQPKVLPEASILPQTNSNKTQGEEQLHFFQLPLQLSRFWTDSYRSRHALGPRLHSETLNMSGITDPYKLYRHIHPPEVGTCMVYLSCLNFINTTTGWISLMSSSGPVKIPVSVCATTLQSIEVTCDIIIFNKAKMMIAGGFDDISEEGSSKFTNVKATSNAETEFAMGRKHTEILRPTTTTRTGFSGSHPIAS